MNYKPEYSYDHLTVGGIKLTAWLDENKFNISKSQAKVVVNFKYSKRCKHKNFVDRETGDIVCRKCFCISDRVMINEIFDEKVRNLGIRYWRRDYDKNRWINYTLRYMKGCKNEDITDQLWLQLAREVPDPFTWYNIYKVFHKYEIGYDKNMTGVSNHWMGFGAFFNLPAVFNDEILYYSEKYAHKKIGKYRVSYNYLLYKFTQLFGDIKDQAKFVPMKGCKKWIENMDEWWKKFCAKEWFEYKQTVIYELYWNKDKQLCKLARSLKEIGFCTKVTHKRINKEVYCKIFNEPFICHKETDEVIMFWRGNELLFKNCRTNQLISKQRNDLIKHVKYKINGKWIYFENENGMLRQIPDSNYLKIYRMTK